MARRERRPTANQNEESIIAAIPMISRKFTDRTGRAWVVAESPPRLLALLGRRERRGAPRSHAREPGRAGSRLATRELDVPCLQFESSRERRRLSPIPSAWAEMREDELEDLLGASTPAPPA
ncbi:MAG TPA: hypothetical protein VN651_08130 [Gemmatimonadaceae bacterium]|nr:hypothetical protein [Gemmatimonadaceae bacterium]